MNVIKKKEFDERINKIRNEMIKNNIGIFLVYGDEYRCENIRYVSNFWPACERGILVIGLENEPVLLVSPECLNIAKELSIWKDIRLIKELGMSYVPEEVGFSNVTFTSLRDVVSELRGNNKNKDIFVSGIDAMSVILFDKIKSEIKEGQVKNGDKILYDLRLVKSPVEVEILKKANEICDLGYEAILNSDIVGKTEIQAAAIAEKAARDAGAEKIVFSIFGSGDRTNTVIGRATEKIILPQDTIMFALAIQYEGYIVTDEWPFVANSKPSDKQKKFIYQLVEAESIGVKSLRSGAISGEVVKKIKDYFKKNDLEKYDLYPPMHGIGLSEAESPYPDENSKYEFIPGMAINFDVSLFGIPEVGSNRIEEGFVITENGNIALSKLIVKLREKLLS